MSIAQHIVIRPADGRPIFNDPQTRRLFTSKALLIGQPFELVCWGAADAHAHLGTMGEDEGPANELARRLESSLTQHLRLSEGFARSRVRPVRDQSHLYSTLPYIVRQAERHGVRCDPFHEGSSLPDMAGLRLVAPGLGERLYRVAPRFDPLRLLPELGPSPPTDDAASWAEAGAAAFGWLGMRGRGPSLRTARRAVIELACDATVTALSAALNCNPRTVRRLKKAPPSPPFVLEAIIGQARWRHGVRPAQTQRAPSFQRL